MEFKGTDYQSDANRVKEMTEPQKEEKRLKGKPKISKFEKPLINNIHSKEVR